MMKHITEEHKRRISQAIRGTHLSEETKRKLSLSIKGRKYGPRPELVKQKISRANRGKKYGPLSEETKLKLHLAIKGKVISNDHKIKIGRANKIAMRRNYSDPFFLAKFNKRVSRNYRSGIFTSVKNGCNIYFRSSDEVYSYIRLEHDDSVKRFGSCNFSIPYIYKGEGHRYVPDILVEYVDGSKAIIEVKPLKRTYEVVNVIKSIVCKEYCRENGLRYILWTERDIKSGS